LEKDILVSYLKLHLTHRNEIPISAIEGYCPYCGKHTTTGKCQCGRNNFVFFTSHKDFELFELYKSA